MCLLYPNTVHTETISVNVWNSQCWSQTVKEFQTVGPPTAATDCGPVERAEQRDISSETAVDETSHLRRMLMHYVGMKHQQRT